MSGYIPAYAGSAFNTVVYTGSSLPYVDWVPFTAVGYNGGGIASVSTLGVNSHSIYLTVTGSTGLPANWVVGGHFIPDSQVHSMSISSKVVCDRTSQVPGDATAAPNPLKQPTLWVLSPNITNDTHWYHRWYGTTSQETWVSSTASGVNYQYGDYKSSPYSALAMTFEAHPISGSPLTTANFYIHSVAWTATGYCTGIV